MDRIPASERTRERLKALMDGQSEEGDLRSALVRLAARLIVEEGLEGEATDVLGREYYGRGAAVGGIRGVCQPRSVRVRSDLPVCRRHRRAAASGATARGGAGRLGRAG